MSLGKWVQELTLNAQGFVQGIADSVRTAQLAKTQIASATNGMASTAKMNFQSIASASAGAVKAFTGLDLTQGIDLVTNATSAVTTALTAVAPVADVAGGGVLAFSLKTAAAVAAVAALEIVTLRSINQLGKLAERFGITVEAVQEMQRAFQIKGLDASAMTTSFSMFARRIGEAKEAMQENRSSDLGVSLQALGLNANEFVNLPLDQAFRKYAVAVSTVSDATDRANLAQAAFGRGSQEVMAMMTAGDATFRKAAEQVRSFGAVTSADVAVARKALAALNDAGYAVAETFDAIKEATAVALAPVVEFASRLVYAVLELVGPLFDILGDVGRMIGDVLGAIGDLAFAALQPFLAIGTAIGNGLKPAWAGIKSAIASVLNPVLAFFRAISKAIGIVVVESLPLIGKVIRLIGLSLEWVGQVIGTVFDAIGAVLGPVLRAIGFGIGLVLEWVGILAGFLEKIPLVGLLFKGWGKDLAAAGKAMRDAMDVEEVLQKWGPVTKFFTRVRIFMDEISKGKNPLEAGQEAERQVAAVEQAVTNEGADRLRQINEEFVRAAVNGAMLRNVLDEMVPDQWSRPTIEGVQNVRADLARQAESARNALQGVARARALAKANDDADKKIRDLRDAILAAGMSAEHAERERLTRAGADHARIREIEQLQQVRRVQEAQKAVADFNRDLESQLVTWAMTKDQAALYKLEIQGATGPMLEQTRILQDQLRLRQELADSEKRAQEITDNFKSPLDKFLEGVGEAQSLFDGGFLNETNYQRQIAKLAGEFERSMQIQYTPPKALLEGSNEAYSAIAAAKREGQESNPQERMLRLMEEARERERRALEYQRRIAEATERAVVIDLGV